MTENSAPAFDPSVFEASLADTADMVVNHPVTGEPTSWVITFAGPGHPQQIELTERLSRKFERERRAKEQAVTNGKKWKAEELSPDERRAENVGIIVDQIVGWRGSSVPFSKKTATEMLLNPKFALLLKQVNEFLESEKAFIKASATT